VNTADFDYDLPAEFIAQSPTEPRDHSRLLVLNRQTGEIQHAFFYELGRFLDPGDLLVVNETRVIPARLLARKMPSGGRAELLLLRRIDDLTWEALVGGKGLVTGRWLQVDAPRLPDVGLKVQIHADLGGARRLLKFSCPVEPCLDQIGHVPLPPYIHTALADPERYQTVYANRPGSAAAPTAGLHFTPGLIEKLMAQGIGFTALTLHVGLDTFAPVSEDDPRDHKIHTEWCQLSPDAAAAINQARQAGRRVVAVGTTSVRTLESAASMVNSLGGKIQSFEGPTGLFILPGYAFRLVDALITNFHLPRSTLLMLVSAFAGRERILAAYKAAQQAGYRFYSFGDAMLVL
jgi:S-adenosylmethionine:tRNA ribosyltransferase-isomerase